MQIRIFTLPFDETSEGFPDEIVTEFCLNKKVHGITAHFFTHENRAFWSVAVQYEVLLRGKEKLRDLDDAQKQLFERLREWRKEEAAREGIPVYLVATNDQFVQMIRLKSRSLKSFKNIKGFGKKRIGKYGKKITELIKAFYEAQSTQKPDAGFPF